MKVLMLGWEFPPHISGGLGTACFGLVGGLRHHGVDVVFVVPHVFGDEDESTAQLLGTSGWAIEPPRSAPRDGRGSRAARLLRGPPRTGPRDGRMATIVAGGDGVGDDDGAGGDRGEDGEQEPTLHVLGVDSALAPYLGPEEYCGTSARSRAAGRIERPRGRGSRARRERSRRRTPPTLSSASSAEPATASDPGQPGEHTDAEPPAPEPAGPISLGVQGRTGRYSRDLFAEVGRYTMVLADIARREGARRRARPRLDDLPRRRRRLARQRQAAGRPRPLLRVRPLRRRRQPAHRRDRAGGAGRRRPGRVRQPLHRERGRLALPHRRPQDPRRPQRRHPPRAAPRVAPGEGDRRAGGAVPRAGHLPEGPRLLPAGGGAGGQGRAVASGSCSAARATCCRA